MHGVQIKVVAAMTPTAAFSPCDASAIGPGPTLLERLNDIIFMIAVEDIDRNGRTVY
jgi:hypothetical protein